MEKAVESTLLTIGNGMVIAAKKVEFDFKVIIRRRGYFFDQTYQQAQSSCAGFGPVHELFVFCILYIL
jgi:hypothetical protein